MTAGQTMTAAPRVTIEHDNTDEVTFATATSVELTIKIEFDHGDHEAAITALTDAAGAIGRQLDQLRPEAVACPCTADAPGHVHGQGGYAAGPQDSRPAETCSATSTVSADELEAQHRHLHGLVVHCTGEHHDEYGMHSRLLTPSGPWCAWPMSDSGRQFSEAGA